MKYPPYYINRPWRITIMLLLISTFFIVSPILILYTEGYRYDWESQTVLTTGVLSIDIEPDDARVFINNQIIKDPIPIRLADLSPNNYTIRLEKDGHHTWEKSMIISSNQTTYINNITLPELHGHNPHLLGASKAIISPNSKYIAYTQDNQLLVANNASPDTILYTFKANASQIEKIDWAPHDDFFMAHTTSTLTLLDPSLPQEAQTFDIISPLHTQWEENNTPALFISEEKSIYELNREGKQLKTQTSSTLWYIDRKNNLWEYDAQKNKLFSEQYTISLDQAIDTIIAIDDNKILLQYKDTLTIIHDYQKETQMVQTLNTTHTRYLSSRDEWLAWSPWELWVMPHDEEATLRLRTSEHIQDVALLYKEGTLLLNTNKGLIAFNPNPLYYTMQELITDNSIRHIWTQTKEQHIYFSDIDDNIYSLKY
ncbi:PEGA domain-containing protein [Patescibacteria group bacterium]|nr:PEGA domain-containing protein [Patescibacteria group bacterium]MBU1722065.1 PEGA domain-containing protein [Patescibacteria group bacterium]MBU1901536.1 PEGA domain-containing protein [Patescibacteria group bacterium]